MLAGFPSLEGMGVGAAFQIKTIVSSNRFVVHENPMPAVFPSWSLTRRGEEGVGVGSEVYLLAHLRAFASTHRRLNFVVKNPLCPLCLCG